ncbi:MAG: hypothetical protein J5705_07285 [Bacteroidaceae bacterium]|nr:hypothetical protein [Bacteroidaceae bacterium]
MFTKLIRRKGSYMTLAALAALAIAALATLLQAPPSQPVSKSASGQPEQVITSRLTQYNESSVTFIN